ncbi:MAG: hypothetical protein R3Y16_02275 [Rikenellaceae bacterium]
MKRETLLDGTREFIGKEIYLPTKKIWINQDNFEAGKISWQFCLSTVHDNCEQGTIIERTPSLTAIEMEYIYNPSKQRLIVDAEIEDKYEVTPSV